MQWTWEVVDGEGNVFLEIIVGRMGVDVDEYLGGEKGTGEKFIVFLLDFIQLFFLIGQFQGYLRVGGIGA